MRPLFHPSIEEVTVEAILHALSDPVRVAIFAQIAGAECPQTCSDFLHVSEKTIPKSTLSQHFKALREAGLVRGERVGVEMRNTSRCAEIDKRFPGLVMAIVKAHKAQLEAKARGESAKAKVRQTEGRKAVIPGRRFQAGVAAGQGVELKTSRASVPAATRFRYDSQRILRHWPGSPLGSSIRKSPCAAQLRRPRHA